MNADQWTKLLTVIVSLLQAISWPLLALFILLYLGASLKKFIGNMGEFTLKAGSTGVEATAKRQQIEVAASLGAATAAAQNQDKDQGNNTSTDGSNPRDIARLVSQIVTPQNSRQLAGASILWVDDIPSNNEYQRSALEALGIRFTISTSTEDALEKLRLKHYDAIISDMGRPPDQQAGYTLLEKVKEKNITTPYIIYARGGNKPQNKAEARRRGAFDSVSGPEALFETVIDAIKNV